MQRQRLAWKVENVRKGKEADVQIYGGIGDPWDGVLAGEFNREIRALDSEVERINFLFNSPGGFVTDGIAMHSGIKGLKAKTVGYVEGSADSAASFVLQAVGQRVIAETASIFIHRAQGMAIGDEEDFEAVLALLRDNTQAIAGMYAERAGGTVDEWIERMSALPLRGSLYRGQQAVDIGLADEVGVYSRNFVETRIAATADAPSTDTPSIDVSLIPPLANGYRPPLPADLTRLVAANFPGGNKRG